MAPTRRATLFAVAAATACPLVLGARLAAEEAAELPWRKLAAVGALGAHGLSGHLAAAVPDGDEEREEPVRKASVYQRLEKALTEGMDMESPEDDASVHKLLANLRRGLAKKLDVELQERGLHHMQDAPDEFWWREDGLGPLTVQQYDIQHEDGSRAAVLKRYSGGEERGPEEVKALQSMLRNVKRMRGQFLRIFAASHTAKTLAKADDKEEVLLMLEPFEGTLREYLKQHTLSVNQRLKLFLQVNSAVDQLRKRHIPHNPVISQDNVLVVGDPSKGKVQAMLCPSILSTDLHVCSFQQNLWFWLTRKALPSNTYTAKDLYEVDVQQLGILLEWMMTSTFGEKDLAEAEEVIEANAFASLGEPLRKGQIWPLKELKRLHRMKSRRWMHPWSIKSYEADIKKAVAGARGDGDAESAKLADDSRTDVSTVLSDSSEEIGTGLDEERGRAIEEEQEKEAREPDDDLEEDDGGEEAAEEQEEDAHGGENEDTEEEEVEETKR